MHTVTLNNGVEMPIIGIGLWQVTDQREAENAVYEALKAGYRLIDTAAGYLNEDQSWAPFAEGRNNLFTNETLSGIAARHGKTVAQVVLRWLVQRGIAVIPSRCARNESSRISTSSTSGSTKKTWP